MPNGIIEKLTQHMQAFPEREADVVYALAQVRKILEYGKLATSTLFNSSAIGPCIQGWTEAWRKEC